MAQQRYSKPHKRLSPSDLDLNCLSGTPVATENIATISVSLTCRMRGGIMRETRLTFPELGLVAGTRAAAGIGIGLLLADRLSPEQRKAVGWTLLAVGALTTIPLALEIFGHSRSLTEADGQPKTASQSEDEIVERLSQRGAIPQI
jgi:hypothetical protein